MTTTQTQKRQSAAPSGLAAAAVGSGGTFAAASYFWKITALTALGESAASSEATQTLVLNGSANLTWTAYPGAQWILVYRGTATGAENHLIATLPGNLTAFTDTGAAGTAQAPAATTAWASATKSGAVPTKANQVAGLPDGFNQDIYSGLVGWCQAVLLGRGTDETRNQKYVRAAGYDVQEV